MEASMPKSVPAFFRPFSSALNQGCLYLDHRHHLLLVLRIGQARDSGEGMAAATATSEELQRFASLHALKMHDSVGKPINSPPGRCDLPGRWVRSKTTSELMVHFTNEELVGEALAPCRNEVVMSTKFGYNLKAML